MIQEYVIFHVLFHFFIPREPEISFFELLALKILQRLMLISWHPTSDMKKLAAFDHTTSSTFLALLDVCAITCSATYPTSKSNAAYTPLPAMLAMTTDSSSIIAIYCYHCNFSICTKRCSLESLSPSTLTRKPKPYKTNTHFTVHGETLMITLPAPKAPFGNRASGGELGNFRPAACELPQSFRTLFSTIQESR